MLLPCVGLRYLEYGSRAKCKEEGHRDEDGAVAKERLNTVEDVEYDPRSQAGERIAAGCGQVRKTHIKPRRPRIRDKVYRQGPIGSDEDSCPRAEDGKPH